VLDLYMTALDDPTRVIAQPGGYFLVPECDEYLGDVMNVAFSNGWIMDDDGRVLIYYASADTRLHVAVSTVERLIDYCMNTPEDGLTSAASVENVKRLIEKNRKNGYA
jgi:4-O-beta-D-mannosyl-D-glucose phosphorylase